MSEGVVPTVRKDEWLRRMTEEPTREINKRRFRLLANLMRDNTVKRIKLFVGREIPAERAEDVDVIVPYEATMMLMGDPVKRGKETIMVDETMSINDSGGERDIVVRYYLQEDGGVRFDEELLGMVVPEGKRYYGSSIRSGIGAKEQRRQLRDDVLRGLKIFLNPKGESIESIGWGNGRDHLWWEAAPMSFAVAPETEDDKA